MCSAKEYPSGNLEAISRRACQKENPSATPPAIAVPSSVPLQEYEKNLVFIKGFLVIIQTNKIQACACVYTYVYTQHPKKTSLQKTRQYIIWILIPRDTFVKRLLASVLIIRLFGCCCGWFLKVFQLIHQAESSQFSFKVYISGRCRMGRLVPLELKALTGGGKKKQMAMLPFLSSTNA